MSAQPQRMRAFLLANRIDTRGMSGGELPVGDPFVTRPSGECRAFIFRDGAAALFGASAEEETNFLASLRERLREPAPAPVWEEAPILVREDGEDQVLPDGAIALKGLDTPRLVVVAEALARAAALNYFEPIVGDALARGEPLAAELARDGRTSANLIQLGRRMGEVLLVEHRLLGRSAVSEKPDVLWDHPELERLYARLEAEYELTDRTVSLERKLDLLRTNASFITELVQNQRAQLLELAIIGLICFEIILSILTLVFLRH